MSDHGHGHDAHTILSSYGRLVASGPGPWPGFPSPTSNAQLVELSVLTSNFGKQALLYNS